LALWILGWCVAAGGLAADPLDEAFEREELLLRLERNALQVELRSLRNRGESAGLDLVAAVTALRDSISTLRTRTLEFEGLIAERDRRLHTVTSRGGHLGATLEHADESLREHGIAPLGPEAGSGMRIGHIFERATAVVERLARLRRESGVFYAQDGEAVAGTLVWVGAISALGVGAQTGGLLAPVEKDALTVVDPAGLDVARDLLAGREVELVPVYLADPLRPLSASRTEWNLRDFLRSGGIIVWPILMLGLVAVVIALERLVTLGRVHRSAKRLSARVSSSLLAGKIDEATRLCDANPGAVARVVLAAINHRHQSRDLQDDAISEAILEESTRLERWLPTLRVIAAVTPLLGLLGTVTGMIGTFDVITEFGTGNPKLLSGGISEALVTTELGLIVAIPALLLYAFLAGRVDNIISEMEKNSLRLSLVLRSGSEQP
jgi:biopolymer transport protein ExbB